MNLASLLTPASQARASYSQGQREGQASARGQQNDALKNALLLRQVQQQEEQARLAQALNQAQVGHLGAQSEALLRPSPAPRDYVKEHELNRQFDVEHPLPTAGQQPDRELVQVLRNGKRVWVPRASAVGEEAPSTEPQQSFTPVTLGGGPDQPATVKAFNTRSGKLGETLGEAKPPTTRIESAINTSAKARLEAAVSEMNNAHGGMGEYEEKLKAGTANINGLAQFAGRVANSFTHDDPLSMTIQSTALATLNKANPELARYIRRALSFAEGESMVSQRPSDFRTKMAAFLSAAASGASPEMIGDIQSRRTSILDPLNRTVGTSQSKGGVPSSGPSPLQQKRAAAEAHLKAQGKTPEEILQILGPPDEDE